MSKIILGMLLKHAADTDFNFSSPSKEQKDKDSKKKQNPDEDKGGVDENASKATPGGGDDNGNENPFAAKEENGQPQDQAAENGGAPAPGGPPGDPNAVVQPADPNKQQAEQIVIQAMQAQVTPQVLQSAMQGDTNAILGIAEAASKAVSGTGIQENAQQIVSQGGGGGQPPAPGGGQPPAPGGGEQPPAPGGGQPPMGGQPQPPMGGSAPTPPPGAEQGGIPQQQQFGGMPAAGQAPAQAPAQDLAQAPAQVPAQAPFQGSPNPNEPNGPMINNPREGIDGSYTNQVPQVAGIDNNQTQVPPMGGAPMQSPITPEEQIAQSEVPAPMTQMGMPPQGAAPLQAPKQAIPIQGPGDGLVQSATADPAAVQEVKQGLMQLIQRLGG